MILLDILNAKTTIEKLNTTLFDDVESAIAVAKFVKSAAAALQQLEEKRVAMVKKYGDLQENGSYKVSEKNIKKFEKDFNKLLNEEVDFPKLKVCDLFIKMTPAEAAPLMSIIE